MTGYDGETKNSVPHGQGTFTHPDGSKYVGEFKDGLPNGQGTHTWPDGQRKTGIWGNGEYLGG